MKLQYARGESFGNGTFKHAVNRLRLILAARQNDYFPRMHNVFKSHRKSLTGYVLYPFEQSRIVLYGAFGKVNYMRFAVKSGAGFVECYVSVAAYTKDLKISR